VGQLDLKDRLEFKVIQEYRGQRELQAQQVRKGQLELQDIQVLRV